jgi:hypothetical protein
MGSIGQTVQDNRSLLQTTGGTVASIALEKSGEKLAGSLVTPAIWVYNYATQDAVPDNADIGIYLTGLAGGAAAPAAIATSVLKAIVDDDTARKVERVREGEPPQYRPFIKPCSMYAMNAPAINAQTIASKGGTAWLHPNGVWVYITDARGFLVNDYKPKISVTVYQPKSPLTLKNNGLYIWHIVK